MKSIPRLLRSRFIARALAVGLMIALTSTLARAVPYASGLLEDGDNVSFTLNQDADEVRVILDDGANTLELGALAQGMHTFDRGGAASYQIVVRHDAGFGYTHGEINQISSDDNPLMRFFNQRGVAVNNNPGSPNFGRIYVAVSADGASGGRDVQKGIYVLNPDRTDALGQGDDSLTANLPWSPASSETPNRVFVGPDDRLYIADWSDETGTLYVTDADVSVGEIVLDGLGGPFPVTDTRVHGSINAVHVEGSLDTDDLVVYVIDEDLQTNKETDAQTERNSIWRWEIGGGPLPTVGPPTKVATVGIAFVAQLCDLAVGPDGKFYKSQRRAVPATPAGQTAAGGSGVFVISEDGSTTLWSSLTATRELFPDNPAVVDLLIETRGIAVSPDGRYLASFRGDNNAIRVVRLVEGIPDLSTLVVLGTTPTAALGRDLAFDAAGNLYTVSSGQGLLRVYSPGGQNTAITRSDGTFEMIRPMTVTVAATDDTASEPGTNPGDTGEFTITREGDLSGALTVNYSLSGTAVGGVDYVALPGSATIPAGQASVTVIVTPIDNDTADPTRTVILTLEEGEGYTPALPLTATVNILCDDPPELWIEALTPVVFKRYAPDADGQVRIHRLGLIDVDLFVPVSSSGTAEEWTDYYLLTTWVTVVAGQVSADLDIILPDPQRPGDHTVVVTIEPDSSIPPLYEVGEPSSATVLLFDAQIDTEPVLFSDDFETDTSADWKTVWGSSDNVEDYHAVFNFDYSLRGIPAAPGGSTTSGVIVTANKKDDVTRAAGVNLYAADATFSGNYALRFNMYLEGVNGAGTTEHVIFGINHSGENANWAHRTTTGTGFAATTPGDGDGIWFNIVGDSSGFPGGNAYGAFVSVSSPPTVLASRSAASLTEVFRAPPFRFAGTPASLASGDRRAWVDVEVRQANNVITLVLNQTEIFSFENTTGFNSGTIMLGYNDAFPSIGADVGNTGPTIDSVSSGFVIFDNVRVVDLGGEIPTQPEISGIRIEEGIVQIDFTAGAGEAAGDFTLLSSPDVTGPYGPDEGASISQLSPGVFRASTAVNGETHFYMLQR